MGIIGEQQPMKYAKQQKLSIKNMIIINNAEDSDRVRPSKTDENKEKERKNPHE